MKIDNVIVSVDEKDLYTSYWPYFSEVWDHFGIHPILIYVTKDISLPFPHPSKFGEIIPVTEVGYPMYESLVCRHLAAAVIPGLNFTTDIDLFLCDRKLVDILESKMTKDAIGAYHMALFAPSLLVASQQLFHDIYTANDILVTRDCFWSKEIIDKLTQISGYDYKGYGEDGQQLTRCIKKYKQTNFLPVVPIDATHFKSVLLPYQRWESKRYPTIEDILANRSNWNFDGIRNGSIWQIHIQRDETKELTAYICDVILGRR